MDKCIDKVGPSLQVSPGRLTQQLRGGGTLIVDRVDEFYEPLSMLAEDLEFRLRVKVQVNLYAGWRSEPGFDVHWDKHDVFILQIAGRKHWKVYGYTRPFPLADDIEPNTAPPETPIWDGMLTEGSALYIPRGWWHAATPVDEPTLHLTVGLHKRKGLDFLKWYVDQLRGEVPVRQDVPVLADARTRSEYAAAMRKIVAESWNESLLARYVEESGSMQRPRPRFNFPDVDAQRISPSDLDARTIIWNSPHPVEVKEGSKTGTMELRCNGRNWVFVDACRPVVQLLQANRFCTIREIEGLASDSLKASTIRAFTSQMIAKGLLRVDSGPGSNVLGEPGIDSLSDSRLAAASCGPWSMDSGHRLPLTEAAFQLAAQDNGPRLEE
jgi:hypothetical protein